MARGRLILRSLGSSRKFADVRGRAGKLGEFAQALYPLLMANTDDFGRESGDAFTVKHAVFPTSPRPEAEFEQALEAMHAAGLIQRYFAEDGTQIVQIVDFGKGQPNLHKRTPSRFPEFSGNPPEIPPQLNLTQLNLTEPNRTAPSAPHDGFPEFWTAYPRKKSKADAEKAWRKLAPSPELCQQIYASIAAQRGSADWRRDEGKFIPYPASWLNGRRWEDECDGPVARERAPIGEWCQHEPRCHNRQWHEAIVLRDAEREKESA